VCLTWNRVTATEWIAGESRLTTANWTVIDHLTVGIQAASSRTWISTFLVDTSFVLGTF
jgi:hypothetical protein